MPRAHDSAADGKGGLEVGSAEDAALLESFGIDYFQAFHAGQPVLEPDWAKA